MKLKAIKMKIGTDVSLEVCRNEGYLMAEFKNRKLYKGGKFNPNAEIRFFAHYPDYIRAEIFGTENPVGQKTIYLDVCLSSAVLWEMYKTDAAAIDDMCGLENRAFPENEYEALNLASDINAYKGLE